ncbi:MAG: NIPSNAP family protein [Pseudolabrys sp.]
MLVDARTYTIKPGCTAAQLKIYQELGFPVQVKHIGQPLCYLQAESGEMNTLLHCWVYDSAADREQKRAVMAKDPDWHKYLTANREAGYLIGQRTTLMTPVSFAPLKR